MIPYGKQNINSADIDAVINVLRSPFITQGPVVPQFEQALCDFTGGKFAAAMNSATSALHVACLALGAGEGDMIWTSPNSFVASANCALYCGASVDFVDIDPKTYNLCADALEQKLKSAKKLPKIVIPVAFAGQSANMKKIKSLSDQYGFHIIEDASHAIGGFYDGKPIGCGAYADITIFSFHPVKIITTAEGGCAVTNDPQLYEKIASLRSHGITRDSTKMRFACEGGWYYEQIDLGYNYRMTEMQAALGLSQISRLEKFISERHKVKSRYAELLAGLPVITPYQDLDGHSALHLYPVQTARSEDRKAIFDSLRSAGVGVNVHYIPIHLHPYYRDLGFNPGDFPNAEAYYSRAISLPMYPDLTLDEQTLIQTALQNAIAERLA